MPQIPDIDIRQLYDRFNSPVTDGDCGMMCAPHNPSGKPFCCDICHAVPAVYRQEWRFLRKNTDLWHVWRGDECPQEAPEIELLHAATPKTMRLLACKGPAHCQREYRALSCRQFPFFPFITSAYHFIGLAYFWEFEPTCWVISNLARVTETFRSEFIQTFDELFNLWPEEMDGYASYSEQMRDYFAGRKRSIPILHRRGGFYLLSPRSERLRKVDPGQFRRFVPYRSK